MNEKQDSYSLRFCKENIVVELRDFLVKYKKDNIKLSQRAFGDELKKFLKKETDPIIYFCGALGLDGSDTLVRDLNAFLGGFVKNCYPALDRTVRVLNEIIHSQKQNEEKEELTGEKQPKIAVEIPHAVTNDTVKVGQVWESMDKTRPPRMCVVKGFNNNYQAILHAVDLDGNELGKKPTYVAVLNMKPNSRGWKLIKNI